MKEYNKKFNQYLLKGQFKLFFNNSQLEISSDRYD